MDKNSASLFCWSLLFVALTVPSFAEDLLLKGGHVVDPAAHKVFEGNILIHNGRIESVSTAAPAHFSGTVLDISGKWIIPSLVDTHVHSFGNKGPNNGYEALGIPGSAKKMLYAGVGAFLDLFYGPEDEIFETRNTQREKGLPGADIFAAGPIFTCTKGHGTEFGVPTRVINTPADAVREVTELSKKHPDVIKIAYDHARFYPSIDRATMEAAVKTANKLGLKTIIHIGNWRDAKEAVLAGATVITHLFEEPIPDEVVELMKDKSVYEIPTMTVQMEMANIVEHPVILESPLLKAMVAPTFLNLYRDPTKFDPFSKWWLKWQTGGHQSYLTSLKKLSDAGVKLMTGTDAGNLGTFQGFSLHRELELFSEAGVSAWDTLYAATVLPGEFLGLHLGVTPGSAADLLVLNASPLEKISNTQDIHLVLHHGKVVDRVALNRH